MTSEHITITEEVQKDGQLVTQERVVLQTTTETPEQIESRQAMSVLHPDYVPAHDRVYTWDEELGMSTSKPREVVVEDDDPADQPEDPPSTDAGLCGNPIGNGTCQLPAGHSGSHKLYVE